MIYTFCIIHRNNRIGKDWETKNVKQRCLTFGCISLWGQVSPGESIRRNKSAKPIFVGSNPVAVGRLGRGSRKFICPYPIC